MKIYIVKAKSETLDDVFNGSKFSSVISKTLKDARSLKKQFELGYDEWDFKHNAIEILEVTIKKVK